MKTPGPCRYCPACDEWRAPAAYCCGTQRTRTQMPHVEREFRVEAVERGVPWFVGDFATLKNGYVYPTDKGNGLGKGRGEGVRLNSGLRMRHASDH